MNAPDPQPSIRITLEATGFSKAECELLKRVTEHGLKLALRAMGFTSWKEDTVVELTSLTPRDS